MDADNELALFETNTNTETENLKLAYEAIIGERD